MVRVASFRAGKPLVGRGPETEPSDIHPSFAVQVRVPPAETARG